MKHGYSNSVKNSLMGRSAKIEPPINAEGLDTSISEKERMEIHRVIIVLILAEAPGRRCQTVINTIFICSPKSSRI